MQKICSDFFVQYPDPIHQGALRFRHVSNLRSMSGYISLLVIVRVWTLAGQAVRISHHKVLAIAIRYSSDLRQALQD